MNEGALTAYFNSIFFPPFKAFGTLEKAGRGGEKRGGDKEGQEVIPGEFKRKCCAA